MDFGSHRPTRVPLLNASHRTSRLAWAREHRDCSVEDWKRVAWSDDLRSLARVPTSLNAIRYVDLLDDHLHPLILFCYPLAIGVFQQDNYTSHKSWLATGWLDEHSSDFPVINCLPRS
ncbi:transposable element Tc1 transposase [Trichonephila clavipes]|nr:transposable element Tc1 transposase [Trichonephila clavipes]